MNRTIVSLTLLPTLFCSSCAAVINTNIADYESLLEQCILEQDFHTELYIFPKTTSIGKPLGMRYEMTPDLFTGSYFLFLLMEYNQETFDSELSRVSKIEGHFSDGTVKKILHYENESIYLTVDRANRQEYVLYDKNSLQIAYISNQLYDWFALGMTSKYYLPNLTIPAELDDGDNSYNMYYHYKIEFGLQVGDYVTD